MHRIQPKSLPNYLDGHNCPSLGHKNVPKKCKKKLHSQDEDLRFLFPGPPGDPLMRVHKLCSLHCALQKGKTCVPVTPSPDQRNVLSILLVHTQCYMTTCAITLHHSLGAPSGPGVRHASERHQHRKGSHYLTSPGLPGAIEQIMHIQQECTWTRDPE